MEVVSAHARDVIVQVAFSKSELEMLDAAFERMHMIKDGSMVNKIQFLEQDFPLFVKNILESLKRDGY